MISFRARRFGQSDWTDISIEGPADHFLMLLVGGVLASAELHVQRRKDGEWINLAELEFYDGVEMDEEEEEG